MQTGDGISSCLPVYSGMPVFWFILKAIMLPECSFGTSRKLPSGVIPKFRGHLPSVETVVINSSFFERGSVLKTAMELCPLFEP